MKTLTGNTNLPAKSPVNPRREFLKKSVILGTVSGTAGLGLLTGCKDKIIEEVTPTEDLMREHGLLNRVMLIYDKCNLNLAGGESFPPDALINAALVIKNFIEDYHEILEEKFVFPRLTKANQLQDLVQVLYIQHAAGRKITGQIIELGKAKPDKASAEAKKLVSLLHDFNAMYRPHEAREDTILFPALKKTLSRNEYYALGKDFEDKEHELFGENGFENMVEKVAGIEKQLGIYELSAFTPIL